MKKRLMAILLSLCMLLGLLPVTAMAASVATDRDENGAVLHYEITSPPANGEYYVEGEYVEFDIWLENTSGDQTFTDVYLGTDFSTSSMADSLDPGASTEKYWIGSRVSAADTQAQQKEITVIGSYHLNEQEYTISNKATVNTGLEAPELTDLSANRKDGEITASFTSNCTGKYAYAVLADGESAPADWNGYTQYNMVSGQNSFTISDASAEGKTLCVMAWNVQSEPMENPVSVEITDYIYTVQEGFKALTADTDLPYSGTVTLGGEGSEQYSNNGVTFYAQLMKVEAEEGQMLNLEFYGQSNPVDTCIEVYSPKDDGGFTQVGSYDHDNKNGNGESAKYIVQETGAYYLAFRGYDLNETGMCNLEVSVSDASEIVTLKEGFQGLTETTVLPYSGTVDLGGEGSTLYDMDGWYTYAQLMKVELQEGQLLDLAFYGSSQRIDTCIEIYRQEIDSIEYVTDYDDDNKNGNGESAKYIVEETGTYYLAFEGYEDYETGLCNLEVSVVDSETVTTERLDFTADPVPVPGEDDLWTWDADTKTLTLKDGFQMASMVDDLIRLPDGATVLVEGTAKIYYGTNSIFGIGSVTIQGVDPETSCLTISYDAEDAIELDNGGSLTIENVSMDITAGSDCLITEEDIIVKNARLKLDAGDEGLDPSGDAILENSEVEIYCDGIGIDATNDITVTGGKLIIDADEEALECDYLTFAQGVEIKLNTRDWYDYDLFNVDGIDEFSISDPVALYGSDGTLLYSGPWSEGLMDAYYNPVVDGVQAYRIESGSLCELEITAGANGTWQKGTTEGLSFTANGAIDDFQQVLVDEKVLDATSYTVGENTTITLKPEYLETLSVGEHTISIVFDTGTATTAFTIIEADSDVCDGGEDCPTHDYDDVDKGAWFHPYVDYVVENGIMVGVSTDPYVFMPDANLTRAQVIQTLYQLEEKPETDYVTDYSDVAANQWFAKAIAWGTENGIVEGRDTGDFDPDGNITREELVTILYRYVTEYKKVPVGTAPAIPETYTDADRIGFFAVDAFAWAIDCGIINGMTETTLEPQGLATRAQLTKMITIFLQ